VTLDGVTIKPALALGGWVAFKPMHGQAMVMGDLVLLETEINPVMLKLIEGGLDITAVHLVVGDRHTAGGGECSAFGHGLLLHCETLRSRLRDHFSAAILLLPQTPSVDGIAF
jgi:Domain of Unknown Function (DUF1259)